jgi:nucleoside 2-deoxyribosyltransferase
MIRVYTASKLSAHELWERLQNEWPEVHFHARWLKHMKLGTPNERSHAQEFWLQDEEDVANSDAVLVYGRPDEKLRGALVEAGIALVLGIPVVVVGEHPDYSTWQYHPGCVRVATLEDAREYFKQMVVGYRRRVA